MRISNLKWHKAMGEAGTFFSHDEKNESLPKTLTLEQLAALQHPHIKGDTSSASKEATSFKNWIKSVCLNGDLVHTTTIEIQPLENVGGQEFLRRTLYDELDRVTIHHIKACDFATLLASEGEEPSVHLATWIKATASESLPAEATDASGSVKPAKAGPAPLKAETVPDCNASTVVTVGEANCAPMLGQPAQEARILELLICKGHDPLNLADRQPGKRGTKSEIRAMALLEPALFTTKTFDTAWQRLRGGGCLTGGN